MKNLKIDLMLNFKGTAGSWELTDKDGMATLKHIFTENHKNYDSLNIRADLPVGGSVWITIKNDESNVASVVLSKKKVSDFRNITDVNLKD